MKTLKIAFIAIFLATSTGLFAQYEYPEETNEKPKRTGWYKNSNWFFGTGIGGIGGFVFGDVIYAELAPIAGYKVSPRFWVGAGPMYSFISETGLYRTSVYGGKLFTQFTFLKDLREKINVNIGDFMIYGENQTLNFEPMTLVYPNNGDPYVVKYNRQWVNITLIGLGMRYPVGNRSGVTLFFLWDVTQNPDYRYSNPEIRFSFDF